MASNSKESDWLAWNWTDLTVNNIWWKFYTWSSLDTDNDEDIDSNDTNLVCWIWYHVPSDAEWTTLESYLMNGDVNIWWQGHSLKDSTNNMVEALQIPLSGMDYEPMFQGRGYCTNLLSSTSIDSNNSYDRWICSSQSTISSWGLDQGLGVSVRCIKDEVAE